MHLYCLPREFTSATLITFTFLHQLLQRQPMKSSTLSWLKLLPNSSSSSQLSYFYYFYYYCGCWLLHERQKKPNKIQCHWDFSTFQFVNVGTGHSHNSMYHLHFSVLVHFIHKNSLEKDEGRWRRHCNSNTDVPLCKDDSVLASELFVHIFVCEGFLVSF